MWYYYILFFLLGVFFEKSVITERITRGIKKVVNDILEYTPSEKEKPIEDDNVEEDCTKKPILLRRIVAVLCHKTPDYPDEVVCDYMEELDDILNYLTTKIQSNGFATINDLFEYQSEEVACELVTPYIPSVTRNEYGWNTTGGMKIEYNGSYYALRLPEPVNKDGTEEEKA